MACTLFMRNYRHTFSLLSPLLYKKTGVCPLLDCIAVVVTGSITSSLGSLKMSLRQRILSLSRVKFERLHLQTELLQVHAVSGTPQSNRWF
jgi:hypothetical protein